jgi:hypothetical protein
LLLLKLIRDKKEINKRLHWHLCGPNLRYALQVQHNA